MIKDSKYYSVAALTDIGLERESNQDAVLVNEELGLFAVSDGMGGLSAGEQASRYVRESLPLLLTKALAERETPPSPEEAAELLRTTVTLLSDTFYESVNQNGTVMGATVAALWLLDHKAVFVSLGDSRAYILRRFQREPDQITEDMNLAALLVREGVITRQEARNHPSSSRLTAFVGMPAPATPSVSVYDLHPGDRVLLCSDGLYGMVEEKEMARILRGSRSPRLVCKALIEAANRHGGKDNIAALYLRMDR